MLLATFCPFYQNVYDPHVIFFNILVAQECLGGGWRHQDFHVSNVTDFVCL